MENSTYAPGGVYTILLVETQIFEREKFSQMALTQGWNLISCKSGIEAIQWLQNNSTADILVIQEDSLPLNGYQTADYIKSELGLALPVLITTANLTLQKGARDQSYAEGFLNKPFESATVINQIEQTLSKSIEVAPPQNDSYSLNYLYEIFDGNEECIEESLELFSTSVNKELQHLNNELHSHDYNKIREIAHSIKPSFEMLENEVGISICHLLNNEAKESEMPELIDSLQKEFTNIREQLTRDFPKLNIDRA